MKKEIESPKQKALKINPKLELSLVHGWYSILNQNGKRITDHFKDEDSAWKEVTKVYAD